VAGRFGADRSTIVSVRATPYCQPSGRCSSLLQSKQQLMRHTREAIDRYLDRQASSGQTVAAFCADNGLKIPTFYAWKKKYAKPVPDSSLGFCELTPVQREVVKRKLCLPSGLQLEITGLSTREIAQLLVEIDRAHV